MGESLRDSFGGYLSHLVVGVGVLTVVVTLGSVVGAEVGGRNGALVCVPGLMTWGGELDFVLN